MVAEIWILVIALSVLGEIITNAYVGLFIGLGALLGFLAALLAQPLLVQLILVVGVSAAGIVVVRPLALADLRRTRPSRARPPRERPARTRAVARERAPTPEHYGVVETHVGDENHPGSVVVDGRLFRAVTDYPRDLPDGTRVVVRAARGGTLWVEPY